MESTLTLVNAPVVVNVRRIESYAVAVGLPVSPVESQSNWIKFHPTLNAVESKFDVWVSS